MADRSNRAIERIFDALGDPTRRRILEHLSSGPRAVSSLSGPLKLTVAAILQHVQCLERSGLVRTAKVGRVRTCEIESKALADAERWLADRRARWEENYDKLAALLGDEDGA
ncbi:MAG TPA: metalloregulator ArsR/SmtB family transcription factor [Opitutaceae bacterium]|nr:metalloregulator ArsR/SmtB family transcription factor [Opitutaceae bacterium]